MIGLTLCSGIGAPEVAAPWVDWRFAADIDPFPRAVLAHRFGYREEADHKPGDPLLWDDMTEARPALLDRFGVPLPELIVAGTPCQAFSFGGLRRGVADPRGNLTLKFVGICHEFAAARADGRLSVVWENVAGVLTDKDNAFGCFLGGLVRSDAPLPAPPGGIWPRAGMVAGGGTRIAWRVLNAKYFGLPQRRERVFVVMDFGGALDPANVLFERKGAGGTFKEVGSLDGCGARFFSSGARARDRELVETLCARDGKDPQIIIQGDVVRRLAPVEYERLQGFPDGHTAIPWRGRPADRCPPARRYKGCGNSISVNVMRWVLDGVRASRA